MSERSPLPRFFCPIDSAIHPGVDAIEKWCIDWIRCQAFCGNDIQQAWTIATNSAEFMCRLVPEGTSQGLRAAAAWVYWGFSFDDSRCDAGASRASLGGFIPMALRLQRCLETPDGMAGAIDDRYAGALADIGRMFRQMAPPVQMRRFIDAHRAWLTGTAWQIANQAAATMPGLNDFTAQRINSAGGPPTIAMLEIASDIQVPGDEFESPAVRALTEMTYLIAGWDNDLYSYDRERRQGHSGQNLVSVLSRRHQPDDALRLGFGFRDRVMTRFLALREQTARRVGDVTCRYLSDLGHVIRGNLDWALHAPRYTSLARDHELPDDGIPIRAIFTDHPSDATTGPPPIPAISWWWDDSL